MYLTSCMYECVSSVIIPTSLVSVLEWMRVWGQVCALKNLCSNVLAFYLTLLARNFLRWHIIVGQVLICVYYYGLRKTICKSVDLYCIHVCALMMFITTVWICSHRYVSGCY